MRGLIVLALAALAGCVSGGAAGGGGNEDPLPAFQLGQDPALDADVAALTAGRNEALACVNAEERANESDVFLALKRGYVANHADGFCPPVRGGYRAGGGRGLRRLTLS